MGIEWELVLTVWLTVLTGITFFALYKARQAILTILRLINENRGPNLSDQLETEIITLRRMLVNIQEKKRRRRP
jgi:hypothetical protein